jgi:hypothetical protein
MGEVRASDGKVFWGYSKEKRADGSFYVWAQWMTPEAFSARRQRVNEARRKRYQQTPEYIRRKQERDALPSASELAKQRAERKRQMAKEYAQRPEVKERARLRYHLIKQDQKKLERYKEKQRAWQQQNKERFCQLQKAWRKKNINHCRDWANSYYKERYASDPQFAAAFRVRNRIYEALKKKGAAKSGTTQEAVGCSFEFLRQHIERQFKGSMSWDNPGSFHIDHIVPLASFDLTDPAQLKVACNWQNLRPIPPKKNMSKGAKLTEPQMHLPLSVTNYTFSQATTT